MKACHLSTVCNAPIHSPNTDNSTVLHVGSKLVSIDLADFNVFNNDVISCYFYQGGKNEFLPNTVSKFLHCDDYDEELIR